MSLLFAWMLLFPTCFLVMFGIRIAKGGLDALERRERLAGIALFWCGVLLALAFATLGSWLVRMVMT